jgi:hypothetical protein
MSGRKPAGDDAQRKKEHLDEKLDEALRGTFPASDPIELTAETEPPPARDEDAPAHPTPKRGAPEEP